MVVEKICAIIFGNPIGETRFPIFSFSVFIFTTGTFVPPKLAEIFTTGTPYLTVLVPIHHCS